MNNMSKVEDTGRFDLPTSRAAYQWRNCELGRKSGDYPDTIVRHILRVGPIAQNQAQRCVDAHRQHLSCLDET